MSDLLLTGTSITLARAGAKAATLASLQQHFDIPPILVIAPGAFAQGALHSSITDTLVEQLTHLGPGPYAVRSSAREEDGAAAAHAGQFLSLLNVAADDVADAALRVWRSGFADNVLAYRRAQGLDDAPQPPAVLVQAMVPAVAAGVAFSADPVSGDQDTVVISATRGLADRLVSGEVDGDQYWVAADDTLRSHLASEEAVLSPERRREVAALARRARNVLGAEQDVEWAYSPDGTLYLLQSRPITTLASSDSAGSSTMPATEGQAQGITLTIWDSANIIESYPGVVSPLTFSFARYIYAHVYRAFSRLMGVSQRRVDEHRHVFENMLGRLDGRVYYNLLNWYRALALFPGFANNRKFMESMMGTQCLADEMVADIVPPKARGLALVAQRLRMARVATGLLWHQVRLAGTVKAFYARLESAMTLPDEAIGSLDAGQLAGAFRDLERQLLQRWDAPLINDFICMIAFGASRKWLEHAAGKEGLALHADTLIGRGDIVSAEPARMIREMGNTIAGEPATVAALANGDPACLRTHPALREPVEAYLARFADRCTQELKLESLTLHDDLQPLAFAVAASAQAAAARPPAGTERGADQRDANATTTRPPRRTLASTFPSHPVKRWFAGRLLAWASARVRDRENLRFERTRLFGRVRRIFLAMGARLQEAGVLDDARQVFCLTVDELLAAAEGTSVTQDLRQLAALRQRELDASLARPDPPERLSLRSPLPSLAVLQGALHHETSADAEDDHRGEEVREGLACCQGIVTARVRVITDPRREGLKTGEILVARHTDPGWIAVFAAAAGVIAERGSLLSHSAIVARELGLPCVVAVPGVTAWLESGDLVRLDGGLGTITRVQRASDFTTAVTPDEAARVGDAPSAETPP
ncbi:MAG: PEP/pyruvate-binding domain-containing protein [Pseudomonadota bacterium]